MTQNTDLLSDETAETEFVDAPDEAIEGCSEGELVLDAKREVVLHKADRSLTELHTWYKDGELVVDPEWQRQYVWKNIQASKLIESFVCEIPIPVIYLAEDSSNKYEVIDGLQRLTSVFRFFEGNYKLSGLEIRPELNGLFFKDLPEQTQRKLKKATVRTFELSPSTSNDLKFIIFERLNTGGVALNDMEIRNCLYRGSLNSLIKRLTTNEDFKQTINQKEIGRRMADRALILRFLAFYERTHHKAKSGLKKFMNDFLETYRNAGDEKIAEYEKEFRKCMKACLTVFGENAFRLLNDGQQKNTEWAGRPNAAIFQVIASSFSSYDLAQITRRSDAIMEEYLDLITTDTVWVDNVRRATGESTRMGYVFDVWQDRLKKAMNGELGNDPKRGFSSKLKEEMFSQDNNCAICGNQIKVIRDACLDHELHYWRGGKTVPENARLVHRLCNLKRGGGD